MARSCEPNPFVSCEHQGAEEVPDPSAPGHLFSTYSTLVACKYQLLGTASNIIYRGY